MKRAFLVAVLLAGLLHAVVPAETPPPDALKFFKNYFVTGSYVVGGVGLKGKGVGGIATGSIQMTGAPVDLAGHPSADILAAFLYWQEVTKDGTGNAGAVGVKFNGSALSDAAGPFGKVLGSGTPPCWSAGGGTGSGGVHKTFTYRADVLRFLEIDPTPTSAGGSGKYRVNGTYSVQLPDGSGTTALGASLVVIYRDLTKPLNGIVLYDGAYTMDQSTQGMSQSIKWFYDGGTTGRLTHIVGSGQANKSEILRFNGLEIARNPFDSLTLGPNWDNPTYGVSGGGATEVSTSVDHAGFSSFDCLTWAAVIYETPVKDTDGDGLLDAWESATPPKGPYDDPLDPAATLPNLYAMGARDKHKDVFVEIGWMTTGDTSYGGVAKPAHSHLPTPAAIKLMGDAFRDAPVVNPDGFTGIRLHVDAGPSYEAGTASDYIISPALARGGEWLPESITTPTCDRDPLVDPVWKCQFSDHPGTVGWKTGFRYIRDEVIGTTDGTPIPPPPALPGDDDPCDAPDSKCVRRFDRNRHDMFHYAFFAHAVGMPKSMNACVNEGGAEVPDVDGYCPEGTTPNSLFYTPRTNSGIGDFPGGDMLVTLGAFSDRYGWPGGTDFMVASTFMHEFGHNAELRHGARQPETDGPVFPAPNCNPIYMSVMNYAYQLRGLLDDGGKPHLDFSREKVGPAIDEASLSDGPFPVGGLPYRIGWYTPLAGSYLEGHPVTIAGRHCDGSLITDGAEMVRIDARTRAGDIDWNANGELDAPPYTQDVNFNGRTAPAGGSPELPEGFNDWDNIRLNQLGARRNVGAPFLDASGRRAFGPLSADLARTDWARTDWARTDWARTDWARTDWAQADWGDQGQGDIARYEAARTDWARTDWARTDWARTDWARTDWAQANWGGDDGRGDMGGGDLFVGDPNFPGGCLDHETATLLANTAPYEFTCSLVGVKISCSWAATNEGGELRYDLYRVSGKTLSPGQDWVPVASVNADGAPSYSSTFDDALIKNDNYLYFATAVYRSEPGGAGEVESNPSDTAWIVGPNHPPVAVEDSYLVAEDNTLTVSPVGVLGNDTDVDSDSLSALLVSGPSYSQAFALNANGSFTYTPRPDYYGPDGFTYKANDGSVDSNIVTVSITVSAANDAPVATTGLSVTAAEDTPTAITLNGSDVDGNPLTFAVTTLPAHGTLSGSPPNLTYTPALNYNGMDGLAFTVSDGSLTSTPATVSITLTAVNDAPVAVNDGYSMLQGSVLTIAAPGVLGNDTDVDSGSLTAVLVGGPTSGTVGLSADGSFTFTPNPSFSGSVSFTYKASDGRLDSNVATVSITVNAAYTLFGLQNVPPAVITKSKAGSTVPMKWQFKNGSIVVNSSGVHHRVTVQGTTTSYTVSDTDPGSSSFRYDAAAKTWYFNLQTKDASGVPYPVGDYQVTITPSPSGYLPPSPSPFKLMLTR